MTLRPISKFIEKIFLYGMSFDFDEQIYHSLTTLPNTESLVLEVLKLYLRTIIRLF